jgi:hypothetical protein
MQPAWPYSGPVRAALAALFSPIFIIKINDIISDLILSLHSWRIPRHRVLSPSRQDALVLEISHWHAAIQTPDGEAMPKEVRMYSMPILARLILALDLL